MNTTENRNGLQRGLWAAEKVNLHRAPTGMAGPGAAAKAAVTANLGRATIRRVLRRSSLALSALIIVLPASGVRAQSGRNVNAIRGTDTVTLSDKGDAAYTLRLDIPTESIYIALKQAFPNPYVLARTMLGSPA